MPGQRFAGKRSRRIDRDQPGRGTALFDSRVPALTVVAHPESSRIGERVLLPGIFSGRPAELSRHQPLFAQPGSSAARPLDDRHLSRQSIVLEAAEAGGLSLQAPPTSRLEIIGPGGELDGGAARRRRGPRAGWPGGAAAPPAAGGPAGELGRPWPARGKRRRLPAAYWRSSAAPGWRRRSSCAAKPAPARSWWRRRCTRPRHAATDLTWRSTSAPCRRPRRRRALRRGPRRLHRRRAAARRLFLPRPRRHPFLDEIGEASLELQTLLLRALESGEIQPVGAEAPRRVDVRVIAATDAELEALVTAGRFRAPLLHRLQGDVIVLPPLRRAARRRRPAAPGLPARGPGGGRPSAAADRPLAGRPAAGSTPAWWPVSRPPIGPATCASCATCPAGWRSAARPDEVAELPADLTAALAATAARRLRRGLRPGRQPPGGHDSPRAGRRRLRPIAELAEEEIEGMLESCHFNLKAAAERLGDLAHRARRLGGPPSPAEQGFGARPRADPRQRAGGGPVATSTRPRRALGFRGLACALRHTRAGLCDERGGGPPDRSLPAGARARPRQHGRRLRRLGRAARAPGGAQGDRPPGGGRPAPPRTLPPRGAGPRPLEHPAIVGIHDLLRDARKAMFLVLQFVDGPTLARLREGPLAPPEVAAPWPASWPRRWRRPTAGAGCTAISNRRT